MEINRCVLEMTTEMESLSIWLFHNLFLILLNACDGRYLLIQIECVKTNYSHIFFVYFSRHDVQIQASHLYFAWLD